MSYCPKDALWSLSDTLHAYFKLKPKTTVFSTLPTPKDSPATKNASFHVENSKAVTTYNAWSHTHITVLLLCGQAPMAPLTSMTVASTYQMTPL